MSHRHKHVDLFQVNKKKKSVLLFIYVFLASKSRLLGFFVACKSCTRGICLV